MPLDAVVIGGGQAGLAVAWHLRRAGLAYRLLDAGDRIGGSWPHYYDSLTLFSPAAYSSLPGMAFPGPADAYPRRDEVVRYLESYVRQFELPLELGRHVRRVVRDDGGFVVDAGAERIATRTVIAATGAFSVPHVPGMPGLAAFRGNVLHSRDYRSPEAFAGRRVVVVGGANSAVQIAHELSGVADVTLASRRPIRFVPQRLLGKDFHFWLKVTGLDHTRWLDDQSTPVLDDGTYRLAIRSGRLRRQPTFERVLPDAVQWRDGRIEQADVLLFATGFRPAVACLEGLAPLDGRGRLAQRNGVSIRTPGLYFAGFPRQRGFASATLRGVGRDAEVVVAHIKHCVRSRGMPSARAGRPLGQRA